VFICLLVVKVAMDQVTTPAEVLRRRKEAYFSQRLIEEQRQLSRSSDVTSSSGEAGAASAVADDNVLEQITARITSKLKDELKKELAKEEKEMIQQKDRQQGEMECFLAGELEQATCPICYELMKAPKNTPTLLFPCGHTFCIECLNSHIKLNSRGTCPYCRVKIQNQAPNLQLQQLIDGFAGRKEEIIKKVEKVTRDAAESADSTNSFSLRNVSLSDREQLEDYRREWRTVSMRYRIYTNEAKDCDAEIKEMESKLEATRIVRKHLHGELEDAFKRMQKLQEEIDFIESQLHQQKEKEKDLDADIMAKRKRMNLVNTTKDSLEMERAKIRLLVEHSIPDDVDVFLES